MPSTAMMMVAASAGSGSCASQPVGTLSSRASRPAVTSPASGVLAPAAWLTAEREIPPVTGNPPDTALARLAAPRPSSSRLVSMRSPRFCARVMAADWPERKIMKPISSEGTNRLRN
ncbi:hypothetical protein D9M68_850500 [compost metagenome]